MRAWVKSLSAIRIKSADKIAEYTPKHDLSTGCLWRLGV